MPLRIKTAAVIGAGTMGAQVAAHLANAGVGTLLLDVTRDAARAGLERARALRPDPFYTPTAHTLIRTGGLDEDLAGISQSDWIIEAVVEQLDVKRALFERIEAHRRVERDCQLQHVGNSHFGAGRGSVAKDSAGTFSARTSSTRRAICTCSR